LDKPDSKLYFSMLYFGKVIVDRDGVVCPESDS
jgi:hypothetical protein